MAKTQVKPVELPREYEVTDPLVKPDLGGKICGVWPEKRGNKTIVKLTRKQAEYFLDHATIRKFIPEA